MKKAVTKVRKPDPREAVWTNWRLISEMIEAGRSPSIEDLRIALWRGDPVPLAVQRYLSDLLERVKLPRKRGRPSKRTLPYNEQIVLFERVEELRKEMEEKGVPAPLTAACRQFAVELSAHRQQRHSQPTKATKTVKRYYKAAKARFEAMLADQKTNAQRGKK